MEKVIKISNTCQNSHTRGKNKRENQDNVFAYLTSKFVLCIECGAVWCFMHRLVYIFFSEYFLQKKGKVKMLIIYPSILFSHSALFSQQYLKMKRTKKELMLCCWLICTFFAFQFSMPLVFLFECSDTTTQDTEK